MENDVVRFEEDGKIFFKNDAVGQKVCDEIGKISKYNKKKQAELKKMLGSGVDVQIVMNIRPKPST